MFAVILVLLCVTCVLIILPNHLALFHTLHPTGPTHSTPHLTGTQYACSDYARIRAFADRLMRKHSLIVCVRWPRGRDVLGACGQLATKQQQQPPVLTPQIQL
jgi:hypothetical protein